MRVLSVIDSLVPGGAETSLAVLAPHLAPVGVELHVAQLHDRPGLGPGLVEAGVPLHDLSERTGRLAWASAVTRLTRDLRPDLVHTTLYEADVAGRIGARRARTPAVSTLATERYGPTHVSLPHLSVTKVRAAQVVDAVTARLAVRLHAVSTAVADVMARNLRYPRDRIDVIGRAREPLAELETGERAQLRTELGAAPDDTVLLAVARHDQIKGLDVLVEAVAGLRQDGRRVRLWIAGRDDNGSVALRAAIEREGLRDVVELLGHRDDVGRLLRAADVFVLPSRREGAPGALLEAMAARATIVATDLPTVREILGGGCAALVPPGRADLLGGALASAIDDPADARRRAGELHDRFTRLHSPAVIAAETRSFYERALGRDET